MKISNIDVYQVDLPYAGDVYHLSGGRSFKTFDATLVCVRCDSGLEGWGESTPFGSTYVAAHGEGVRAGIQLIAPHLIGQDPRCFDRNYDLMDACLAGHPHVKAALDVACWDVAAKSFGVPVCDLLGGRTDTVLSLISSISCDSPEAMRDRVKEFRAKGYIGHSIKIGASENEGGPLLDAQRIAACVADRQPGEYFLADANGGLSVEHALRMLRLLPNDIDIVLEAPCATWHETARLRSLVNVPIHIDELAVSDHSVAHLLVDNIADGFGLKISKNGGLSQARRQRDIAQAAGLVMSVQDTVGSEVAFAAVVHLAQSIHPKWLRCVLDTRELVDLCTGELSGVKVGRFDTLFGAQAVSVPGLGVSPNMDVLGQPVLSFS